MLQVSLHRIAIHAPVGLYAEEAILGNDFEVDVDVWLSTAPDAPLPFADYTIINAVARKAFTEGFQLLEPLAHHIHILLSAEFPDRDKIRVCIRKLRPPMAGEVGYAQVAYEA